MNSNESVVVFRIDQSNYALDLTAVERSVHAVEVTPLPAAPDSVWGAINVHGSVVPVFNLRRRLGLTQREIGLYDHFLLARTSKGTVALVADNVLGVVNPAVDMAGAPVSRLDPETFLSSEEQATLNAAIAAQFAPTTSVAA